MINTNESFTAVTSRWLGGALALLMLLPWLTTALSAQTQPEEPVASSAIGAKHLLGFEDVKRNTDGELSIEGDTLRFVHDGTPAVQVSIASIQNVSVGEQDKQVGGIPLMLGKAAIPYSGGRVVSLFSHKKFDSLAIDYVDSTGGFHGAVFRVRKGEGELFRYALMSAGAHIGASEVATPVPASFKETFDAQQWSLEVERIDPGATDLDPSFADAIYENLLRELPRSKRFKEVFRSGDRGAQTVPGLLVLKMHVEKYAPGSETKRAVTTVLGATQVKVRVQLVTRDGRVLLDRTLEGDVRFMGDNFRATNTVAKKTAKALKGSTFATPAELTPEEKTTTKAEAGTQ